MGISSSSTSDGETTQSITVDILNYSLLTQNTGDTAKNDGRGGSNSRKGRRNKPDGEQAAQARAGLTKSGQSRQTTPGQQKTGRDKFNRDNDRKPSKGKSRNNERPKQFAASPKKSQQIDPDNPFAAALMGLKDKI